MYHKSFRAGCRWAVLLVLAAGMAWRGAAPVSAADGPSIIVPSVHIHTWTNDGYWAPGAKEPKWHNTSWYPRLVFTVLGPVAGGSQLSAEFTKPDGSTWLNIDCPTQEIKAGERADVETPRDTSTAGDKKFTRVIGVFKFKIHLKNELTSTNQVLFSGHFKVSRLDKSNGIAQYKNACDYYIDLDGQLPIGYIGFRDDMDSSRPKLAVWMWLKGDPNMTNVAAYLFYKGQQIGSTKDAGGGGEPEVEMTTVSGDHTDPTWKLWEFSWGARPNNAAKDEASANFFLDKNPGDYEVKVLREGKLSRQASFKVGDDGKVVDNGIATANNLGTPRMILPVKILGTLDGSWDRSAWKTEAFYGNPLKDFTAP